MTGSTPAEAPLLGPVVGECLHLAIKIRFSFETNPGQLRYRDIAAFYCNAVWEPPKWLEQVRIGLVTTQAEVGCDVERHLVAAVGDTATRTDQPWSLSILRVRRYSTSRTATEFGEDFWQSRLSYG